MKRALFALALILVVLGSGSGSAIAGKRERVVTGEGVVDPSAPRSLPYGFKVEARGTADKAEGKVTIDSLPAVRGTVKCLSVHGKRAAIAGKLERETTNGRYFLILLEDNGPAQDPPLDTFAIEATQQLANCAAAIEQGESGDPLREGSVRVR
jgi:hypothetical protein